MEDLLALALSRPNEALLAARTLLDARPDPYQASIAHQTAGIVLRDRGDITAAIVELRRGLVLGRVSAQPQREADVRATLGVALILSGRSRQGLAELDTAAEGARGGLLGRILYRRAVVLWELGRYVEVSRDLSTALALLRRAGDDVWRARTLTVRAHLSLLSGAVGRANADLILAEQLFAETGQELEYAMARHNRGAAAITQGELPLALIYFEEAARRYEALGTTPADLALDRSSVLLAAGLARDALRAADDAACAMVTEQGRASKRAELLYAAASAALVVPDLPVAVDRARRASRMFAAQGRDLWQARSQLVLAGAHYAAGRRSLALLQQVQGAAVLLEHLDGEQAQRAHLLAGRIALDLRRSVDAELHLGEAARVRRTAPPLVRSLGWLAKALAAQARGDTRAALSASRSGLAALEEHQLTLGSTELRAYATAHGAELARIAQRQALRGNGDPRRLLLASERWRATAQSMPARRARQDDGLAQSLTSLRAVVRQLDASRVEGASTTALERERRRLEATIRERSMQLSGDPRTSRNHLDTRALSEALGDTRLIQLVEVDGVLHVLTVVGNRIRRHTCAEVPVKLAEHARFLLRRCAHGPPSGALDLLDEIGRRLQQALLGPAVHDLGVDAPIVVVPPGSLQAVPWALLPALRDRVLSVAPSATALLRALRLPAPTSNRVAFVAGPGLGSGTGEVAQLAGHYPDATVLEGASASAEATLAALDGAWLAHVAAHGSFRLDNPLFSALQMVDGPLTVHDFERLDQAPYRLILPCCDSGVGAPVGADELLGLVSSLMPLGSAGVLAALAPINDEATVPLMVSLHEALRKGVDLPQALLRARQATATDTVALATGYSFVAFGI